MLLDLFNAASLRGIVQHCHTQRPLVNDIATGEPGAGSDILILLEELGSNERFENEPPAEIHTLDTVCGIVPGLVERRCVGLCLSAVVVRVERIVDPCVAQAKKGNGRRLISAMGD